MSNEFRVRLLLALQSSLLGCISSNIRAVSCSVVEENITVQVIFDGHIADEDRGSMEKVGSEFASHFDHELVNVECIRIDAPQPFYDRLLCLRVYERKE
ncbi:hypothetical protein FNF07_20585 [Trinickia caryophylli]|uniref:Uncharacterized protein n=1 Tax=Trinickia caryophylli TaxID=28094 RepID=A0A1X7HCI6_TRICW|nr:hypothetical protein C0Z17_29265 [Trinickia caryophylli]TRX13772.1 hypothetical protein FNF07_20585 [Trinickia caryophylli]SMF83408.1 hypothetical protein SAMN06295900_1326 [Trinickia caryophylli]